MIKVTGRAKTNHCEKVISGATGKIIEKIRVNDKFGGVPIKVAIPPMDAL